MAIKTINLKMVIDRSDKPEAKELRQALWTTHEEVNNAVAEIERILLLCRGRSYFILGKDKDGRDIDVEVKADEVQQKTLKFARSVQKKNGKPDTGSNEEILNALRQLYEALVPSVLLDEKGNPKKATAQQAKPYCTPLMLKGSKGGKDAQKKIVEPLPQWVLHKKEGQENWTQESIDWINSSEGKAVLLNFDKKSSWIKLKEGWQDAFIQDQDKQRKKVKSGGIVNVLTDLEQYGLMPLFEPSIKVKSSKKAKETVGAWNQLCFKKAIEHLLTWESWNHRCKAEYGKLTKKNDEKEQFIKDFQPQSIIEKIRAYEIQRHQDDLKRRGSLSKPDEVFKINPRMLRGFNRVKEEWNKKKCTDEKTREDAVKELQSELKGKLGDVNFYLWLAKKENLAVWKGEENPLYEVAQLNALSRLLKKRKQQSLYTVPDAIRHPKWAQFEAPGGTNLKNYVLVQDNETLSVKLPLLCSTADGIREKEFTIRLAASGQINQPEIIPGSKSKLTFFYADEQYAADMGGSDILFNRPFLENRELRKIQDGNIGSVRFKLVIDIEPQLTEKTKNWLKRKKDGTYKLETPEEIYHFRSGLLNKNHEKKIKEGLRVLTVDLGIRTFASCSVFELVKGKPEKGLCWLANKDKGLWARHERSFTLAMPGDNISAKAQEARSEAYKEMSKLRQGKNFIRFLLHISTTDNIKDRKKEFEILCSGKEKFTNMEMAYKLTDEEKASLKGHLEKAPPFWRIQVGALFKKYEKIISDDISKWRKKERPRKKDRKYEMGKSYWGIKYLEDVRNFLRGWSTHGRPLPKDKPVRKANVNTWDKDKQGTFANNLLNHINNKKEDRKKTGGDLIIQSARGKVPVYNESNKKCEWKDKFEPCRLILFEHLARYRFQTDRPPRENSQLMRWSHRSILDEVKQQAAIYGIHIETTGAGFSSKFYAKNGCPGIRVKKLSQKDIDWIKANESIKKGLKKRLTGKKDIDDITDEWLYSNWLKLNKYIPWDGGEFFASFSKNGKLEIIHADINAAQNLQRRFWTRFCDTFRIPVRKFTDGDGKDLWIHETAGARIIGGLSNLVKDGYAKFVDNGDGAGFIAKPITKKQWEQWIGKKSKEEKDEQEYSELDEDMQRNALVEAEETKNKTVLFRDVSGFIVGENNSDRFYDSKEFWGRVHSKINKALRKRSG